jgi:hypothetical protein
MACPATRYATETPSSTTLRRYVQTTPARLRRISGVHGDHLANSVCCFFADQPCQNSKTRIEHRSIEAALGRHIPARTFHRSLCRTRHRGNLQILDHNCIGAGDEPIRNFMQGVQTRICGAFTGASDPANGSDSFRRLSIGATTGSVTLGYRC